MLVVMASAANASVYAVRTTAPPQRGSKSAEIIGLLAAPRAWPAVNGSQRARLPTSWPITPSTSATQARATAIAPTRLRMSAPTPTPMAAKAAFQAMLPPIVAHIAEFPHAKDAPLSDHNAAA